MCQESLIEYLTTWFENKGYEVTGYIGFDKPDQPGLFSANEGRKGQLVIETDNKATGKQIDRLLIEKLLKKKLDDDDKKLIKKHSTEFHNALDSVKICDPAIGSGAFPMGLLHEIFTAKQTLHTFEHGNTTTFDASGVKLNIIQNSIYGVDIEKGAVDIARLRFWLSLVVDEETPKALPNLDYKIVVGNSLVSKLGDDVIDIDWSLNETSHGFFGAEFAKRKGELLKKISAEQKEFFNPDSDKKKLAAEIRKLKIDLLINQLELMVTTKGIENKPNGTGKRLAEQTERYFQTLGWKDSIKQLKKLKDQPDKPLHFFDWKLDFPEVLNELVNANPGFNIVIGNPPYIGEKGNRSIFEEIKKGQLGFFYQRKTDVYYFFFHLAIRLANTKGLINYITTNYYPTATRANLLRNDLRNNTAFIEIINFNELRIFSSATGQHNMISFLTKENNKKRNLNVINVTRIGASSNEILINLFNRTDKSANYLQLSNSELYISEEHRIQLPYAEQASFTDIQQVLNKIRIKSHTLGNICVVEQGLHTGADKVTESHIKKYNLGNEYSKGENIFVVEKHYIQSLNLNPFEKNRIQPFYKNSDISKFQTKIEPELFFIDLSWPADRELDISKIPNLIKHLSKYKKILQGRKDTANGLQNAIKSGFWWPIGARKKLDFTKPKIVAPQRSSTNTFGYNEVPWYASADVYFITEKNSDYSLKYILALLNSKLCYFWLYNMGKRKGEILELYQDPLSDIPIKETGSNIQLHLEKLINSIIKYKIDVLDTLELERQIDNLVYRLYELSYDEVKVIDPEFSLSKKEYESIELE
jgi:adenine-specific DNA-methyltransferase